MADTAPLKITRVTTRNAITAAGMAVLAACATPPPPPPPPPPLPVVVIPPRPIPPNGASTTMIIPFMGADGIRQTININLTPNQRIWNMRSALNVAALNCSEPEFAMLVPNYRSFLEKNKKSLKRTYSDLDKEFRARYGDTYKRQHDTYVTQVYNYFSLPPAKHSFCQAALEVSNEALLMPEGEIQNFAEQGLPKLEKVFLDFFISYENYRRELAAWDAKYAPRPVPVAPGTLTPAGGTSGYSGVPASSDVAPTYTPPSTAYPANNYGSPDPYGAQGPVLPAPAAPAPSSGQYGPVIPAPQGEASTNTAPTPGFSLPDNGTNPPDSGT
ncbi:MAG: hypothetical protein ACK5NN_13200 [Sphingomonadaceae bacterium]